MWPDFFIVGAPKCGTTALSEYLRAHPQVGFSRPKEPHYFCTDFSPRFGQVSTEDEYRACFAHVPGNVRAIGEASVWTMFSNEAVPNLLRVAPHARLIAMIRNPIDLVRSHHTQLLYTRDETVADLAAAWALQGERAAGRSLPRSCREPRILQYAQVAALGTQVARLRALVPAERLHVIVFDDLVRDPGAVYARVLGFLDLPDDGQHNFTVINEAREHRSTLLGDFVQRPSPGLVRTALALRDRLGLRRLGVLDRLREWNTRSATRSSMAPALRVEIGAALRDDVALLSDQLGRDLRAWLDPSGSGTRS